MIIGSKQTFAELGVGKRVEPDGKVSWDPKLVSEYVVTGVDLRGRRWRRSFNGSIEGYKYARGMNPWRGTLWAVDHAGRRHRIMTWVN